MLRVAYAGLDVREQEESKMAWCSSRILVVGGLVVLSSLCSVLGAERAVDLWGRWEKEFAAEKGTGLSTISFTVTFSGPNEARRRVDGFWDGGETFRVRFMPTATGTWKFLSRSEPRVAGLDGVTGSFECTPAEAESPFSRHGRVEVSENGRHFQHTDGTPFFWLVDTAWNGALKSKPEDWERYLDDRVRKKFTGIQFVTTQWRTAYTDADGQVAYRGSKRIEVNPKFYQRLDERVDAVNAKGLLAVPVLLWTLGERSYSPGQLPESEAIRLARYQIARYGAHHVMWFLAGDGKYFAENAERWKRIGRAVFDRPGHAPVFLHPQGMQWPYDAFLLEEKWVSAFGYQSGHGDDERTLRWIFEGPPATKWKLDPPRPVVNLEPPYEDHLAYQSRKPHSDYSVRRAVYWSLLNAPTAGSSYGAHGVWSWEESPNVPLNHARTGVAKPWHEAMDLPGSEQLHFMVELFESLRWWELRPDPALITTDFDNRDAFRHASASRTDAGGQAVVYVPKGGGITVKSGILKPGLRAEWFDPRTGKRSAARADDGSTYRTPDDEDWVLVLRE